MTQPCTVSEPVTQSDSGPSNEPIRPHFSHTVTVLSALVLLLALGAMFWFSTAVPKLERFEEPDRALELMVSRTMEAQDGLRHAPLWQRWLTEWTAGSDEAERAQAIQWYQELVQVTDRSGSQLRLAILQAESGQVQEALKAAASWRLQDQSVLLHAQLIEAAYGDEPLDQTREIELQSALAEALPSGWFYTHLALRLAQRADDQVLRSAVEQQGARRGDSLQQWSRALMVTELACLIVGSVMLLWIAWLKVQRRDALQWHVPGVPPPWPGGIGAAVLLRGGALGAVMTLALLSFAPVEHVSLRALAIPLVNLPLLGLAYVHLLKPAGLNFWDGFGLQIARTPLGRLAGMVLAVVAAGLWGEWVMGRAAESLGMTNHWTEWFDPDLVWAPPSVLAISLLEYIVFAPVFEELAFRGLLYAILRRRLSVVPAALISASIFALAHGYGMIGFVSVLWSGLLWAWIYERTGSLLPGMIAHAINNLLVCLAVMALLR